VRAGLRVDELNIKAGLLATGMVCLFAGAFPFSSTDIKGHQ